MLKIDKNWLCFQAGARDDYGIPRMLHKAGALKTFYTDLWLSPVTQSFFPDKLIKRYHPELINAPVRSFNTSTISRAFIQRLSGKSKSEDNIELNELFRRNACRDIQSRKKELSANPGYCIVYSYAALDIIKALKPMGWKILLMQSHLGSDEEEYILKLGKENPDYKCTFTRRPEQYWEEWKKECELADVVLVNSEWSKNGLIRSGIPNDKVETIPLALHHQNEPNITAKVYPHQFSKQRPMRVLFAGQLNLRKGIHLLFDAARLLNLEAIEFHFAGSLAIKVPDDISGMENMKFHDHLPKRELNNLYKNSDLLLFPTLSDGFGLVQLEALNAGLPVVSSKNCASVITNDHNGYVLDDLNPESIANTIKHCTENPDILKRMSANSSIPKRFSWDKILQELLKIASRLN